MEYNTCRDCQELDSTLCRGLQAGLERRPSRTLPVLRNRLASLLRNPQRVRRSAQVAETHYNFSNTLFERMLDPSMHDSCAGAFRARDLQVWQIVLSPKGVPGGYRGRTAAT